MTGIHCVSADKIDHLRKALRVRSHLFGTPDASGRGPWLFGVASIRAGPAPRRLPLPHAGPLDDRGQGVGIAQARHSKVRRPAMDASTALAGKLRRFKQGEAGRTGAGGIVADQRCNLQGPAPSRC